MAKQNKNYDYRSGAGLLKQQQSALNKKFQAMSPTQKKAYIAKQAKAIGKTTAQVASMIGGAGLARSAGAKVGAKIVASGVTKKTAAAARARGKQYMEQKYFQTGTRYTDKSAYKGGNKYLIPKTEEFAKVAGNAKAGKTARLNPVGRVARKATKIAAKKDAAIVTKTAKAVVKGGEKSMRTARGTAKKFINESRGNYSKKK